MPLAAPHAKGGGEPQAHRSRQAQGLHGAHPSLLEGVRHEARIPTFPRGHPMPLQSNGKEWGRIQ